MSHSFPAHNAGPICLFRQMMYLPSWSCVFIPIFFRGFKVFDPHIFVEMVFPAVQHVKIPRQPQAMHSKRPPGWLEIGRHSRTDIDRHDSDLKKTETDALAEWFWYAGPTDFSVGTRTKFAWNRGAATQKPGLLLPSCWVFSMSLGATWTLEAGRRDAEEQDDWEGYDMSHRCWTFCWGDGLVSGGMDIHGTWGNQTLLIAQNSCEKHGASERKYVLAHPAAAENKRGARSMELLMFQIIYFVSGNNPAFLVAIRLLYIGQGANICMQSPCTFRV